MQEPSFVISKPVISEPLTVPSFGGLSLRPVTSAPIFFGGAFSSSVNSFIKPSTSTDTISIPSIQNKGIAGSIILPSYKSIVIDKTEQLPYQGQVPKFNFDYAQRSDTVTKSITEQKNVSGFSFPTPTPVRPTPFTLPPLGFPSGGFGKGRSGGGKGSRQKYAYTPSLTGIEARVVGTGKATGNTGISVRGVSKKQLAIIEGKGKRLARF